MFVLGEFVRVVTHPSVLTPPTGLDIAIESLDALLDAGATVLTPGERYWDQLRTTLHDGAATGNLAVDAQIVAVCREHGVDEILTEDRDFARFTGMRVRRLS